jgi:hypothetical protein
MDELKEIYDKIDSDELEDFVRMNCTSYDGFFSFYSPKLDEWGDFETWEEPQYALMLECYCGENHYEWEIHAECNCNGEVEEGIYSDSKSAHFFNVNYKVQTWLGAFS